jgi:DNA-binding phage protein
VNYRKIVKLIESEMKEQNRSWEWLGKKLNRDRVSVFKTVKYSENPRWETVLEILKVLGKKVTVQ